MIGASSPLWINPSPLFYKIFFILTLLCSLLFVGSFIAIQYYNNGIYTPPNSSTNSTNSTATNSTSTTTVNTNNTAIITPNATLINSTTPNTTNTTTVNINNTGVNTPNTTTTNSASTNPTSTTTVNTTNNANTIANATTTNSTNNTYCVQSSYSYLKSWFIVIGSIILFLNCKEYPKLIFSYVISIFNLCRLCL